MHAHRSVRSIFPVALLILFVCTGVSTSFATVITIQDPGFENNVIPGSYKNFSLSDPWNILGFSAGAGIVKPLGSHFPNLSASSGSQFGAAINAPFFQTLSVPFDPGFSYRLEFDVAPSTSNADGSGFMASISTANGYMLKVIQEEFTLPLGTSWTRKALVFDPTQDPFHAAAVGSPLTIRFSGFHPTSANDSAGFDNITLESFAVVPVPEPSSLRLMVALLVGMVSMKIGLSYLGLQVT